MKIGIDISQLAFPGSGSAVYTENLVKNLLKDERNEYVLFFSSLRRKFLISNFEFLNKSKIQNPNFQIKTFKFPPLLLEQLWNRFHVLPIEKLIGKIDVFHTSDWLEPPSRCPKVTTIHDLIIYKYPETFQRRGGHDIVANLKRKLAWVKKESALIIAVSESTKQDIIEILKIPTKKIRVIHEACSTEFTEKSAEDTEKIKKKYGIKGDYLLAVGTLEPRKNLKRVIEAFSKVQSAKCKVQSLVIAGKFGWGNQQSAIKFLGYVLQEDLPGLYAGAEAFVYPSLYEGFGLPILEAMACGCPVVTSNVSSMPEVAGEAAVLVNPEEVNDIARGIQETLENREELIEKGKARAQEFSWEKTARETLKVYQEACNTEAQNKKETQR
jgi:glycosyltransferase involved in cell wall biosynthesis